MGVQNKKKAIDWYIITNVREKRLELGLSQEDIAIHLNVTGAYIGHIESPRTIAKYTNAHLNELAKLFNCSLKDFFPDTPL